MGYKNYEMGSKSKKTVPDDPVSDDILEYHGPTTVSKCLCMFAAETRKENSDKYLPATIISLLSGINHTLQEIKVPFSIFDKRIVHFRDLCNTLNVVSSTLHREGVDVQKKLAAV